MRLEKLQLVNFKNYGDIQVDLRGSVHCFLGKNGSGKTNLLEAIHYLSFTKGTVHAADLSNVRHGQDQFLIRGHFEKNGRRMEVSCTFSPERRKSVFENGKEYDRFSEHLGKYPLVLVAPNNIEMIWDGGEVRRKFFDTLLSQVDKEYLEHLIIYQAHLRQRNGLLRSFSERRSVDRDLIDSYDQRLITSGTILYLKRREFVNQYAPLLLSRYDFLVNGLAESVGLQYSSDLATIDFKTELGLRLERDLSLGRTSVGVHRDDFLFTLNGFELKKYGSQGQQKSFLIALKLAEFDYLASRVGHKPLVLLDDIFDKLDDGRIHQLMRLVSDGTFGQIFITDARPGRSLEVLKMTEVDSQNFSVEGGNLTLFP